MPEGQDPFQSQAASFKSRLHHLLIDLGFVPVSSSVIERGEGKGKKKKLGQNKNNTYLKDC